MVDPGWVTEGSKTRKNIIVLGEREKGQSVDAGPRWAAEGDWNRMPGNVKRGKGPPLLASSSMLAEVIAPFIEAAERLSRKKEKP